MTQQTYIPRSAPTSAPIPVGRYDRLVLEQPAHQLVQRELGRLYVPDPRDRKFPLRAVVGSLPREYPSKRWRMGAKETWRDQGQTSSCVGHGIVHLLAITPVIRHLDHDAPFRAYKWAQDNDEWEGSEPLYWGTSVRAGIQWARKELGAVESFFWAQTMDDILARLTKPKAQGGGPLIVGTDFWSGMSNDPEWGAKGDGRWRVEGEYWGGHCYLWIGFQKARKTATAPSTRGDIIVGNSHADNFTGVMSVEEAEYLIFQANGEAAAVVER